MSLPGSTPVRLTADWILPIGAPPIRHGAVRLGDDGRIVAVGAASAVPAAPGVPSLDFGRAAILPGFVNAHTHLELTGLAGRVEDDDFTAWIRGVRDLKAALDPAAFVAAAQQGVRDAFAAGITMVLDTGDSGAVLPALAAAGGAGIVYQEVFGPHPDQCAASLAALESRVDMLAPLATGRLRLGLSPHAPYTVSGPLYRGTAALARRCGLPLAVHLAESRAESAFVTGHDGPFAAAWDARGIPPVARQGAPGAGATRSPVAWLDAHGVLGPDTLCIHAVQLDAADVALLRDRGAGVAHCPLSNQRHGHGAADPGRLLRAGVRLAVGTDSVVSVGRLDMFAELRAARRLIGCDAEAALALGTHAGAGLAGAGSEAGRVVPGWFSDLVVVEIPAVSEAPGVAELILAGEPGDVVATYATGCPVYRRTRPA